MLVLLALMLTVFLVTVVFSVDVAYMLLVRTQLRCATDAAAHAGSEALSRTQDSDEARAVAVRVAGKNMVAGAPLVIHPVTDIFFGHSESGSNGKWKFVAGKDPYNAIQVFGRRTEESESGVVGLFFAKVLGRDSFEPEFTATAAHQDREVCLVIDRSGSMAWDLSGIENSYPPWTPESADPRFLPPHPTLSRWAAADGAVDVFLNELEQTQTIERAGLVTYGAEDIINGRTFNNADINADLTENYTVVRSAMDAVGNDFIVGYTNIGAGIDLGRVVLNGLAARPLAAKTMVVLTDGIWNRGRDPALAAQEAANENITIHTVTFSSGANVSDMQKVAEIGGGQHYHAPDEAALRAAFREIARTLPVVIID